ncbi:3-hydroxyacyl-CoA dehydrogenase PaaH [Nitrococcus mobilis]|uniref:3-hydroxybutyryl-CoA dehydrogenase n=1 Tax=Nitrococcus mobilis Nb-231 TaxID=314278 RepID=A4BNX2_9GAMM|nr:3-hydroxyacyl-CoA dehydrogenase PaaH [Nitrococcus mobilis]EAR22921.1 3-hydroxybutyryl-CoA dehydrogenase [Nitrococcus mobilis Nb-231]
MAALPPTATIGVVGAGTMGAGIAQVAAAAGHPVLLFDIRTEALPAGLERIRGGLERLIDRGKLTRKALTTLMERIRPIEQLAELAPAALIIEAIVEELPSKRRLFEQLEGICSEQAILASNTSALSITALAATLRCPERVVGMHFFNPAPILKLVEVVSGLATADGVAETVQATAASWGKQSVRARSTPGFIVNRIARPYYAEALRLLETGGADVATIDAALREAGGFRMGPFELMDLIGQDINFAVSRTLFEAYFQDPRYRPSLIQQELLDGGRLGRKSGHGFYDYQPGAERPAPHAAPPGPRPTRIVVRGELGPAEPLAAALAEVASAVQRTTGAGLIALPETTLALTDGRSATQRAAEEGVPELVLFDLALDFAQTARVVIAAADQAGPTALAAAAGVFQALGKTVSVIDDSPGLIVLRTVCMLANTAAETVGQGVCTAAACDAAMRGGVNYPRGPLTWAETIGLARVVTALDHLSECYGADRYRPAPLLRRKCYGGNRFHD